MLSTTARIQNHDTQKSLARIEEVRIEEVRIEHLRCGGCTKGCFQDEAIVVLPGDYGSEIEITLSLGDQLVVLTNTLLLPLAGFIVGAVICDYVQPYEIGVVAGALGGLAAGVGLCRTQSYTRLNFSEVRVNE